jgi:hypothetical protein
VTVDTKKLSYFAGKSVISGIFVVVFAYHAAAQTQKDPGGQTTQPQNAGTADSKPKPGSDALDIGDCPRTAEELPPEKDFTCTCPGIIDTSYGGRVWGTYIYSNDSNVCNAAIHSGVVRKGQPAQILIHFVPPPPVLRGTTHNEITTIILPHPPAHPPFQLAAG